MTNYVVKLVHLPTETTFVLSKQMGEENMLADLITAVADGSGNPNLPLENGIWAVIPNKIMQECFLLYGDVEE